MQMEMEGVLVVVLSYTLKRPYFRRFCLVELLLSGVVVVVLMVAETSYCWLLL